MDITLLITQATQDLALITTAQELQNWFQNWLGKNGKITALNRSIKDYADPVEKAAVGAQIQQAKTQLDTTYNTFLQHLNNIKSDVKQFDFTCISKPQMGTKHPLTILKNEIEQYFAQSGFIMHDGPDIESEYYNFDSLNTPAGHPSRSIRDTFYLTLENQEKALLRTHTTSMQARILEKHTPPIRSIVFGNVYRRDDDATHTPMFTQLEGMFIDQNLSVHHLKSWIMDFVQHLLPNVTNIRFRPSFFPFTFASAEVDIQLKNQTTWLELLGCGMMHPKILNNFNIDDNKYQGLAFGMGIERLAMLKFGITDMRFLYDNDTLFLESV